MQPLIKEKELKALFCEHVGCAPCHIERAEDEIKIYTLLSTIDGEELNKFLKELEKCAPNAKELAKPLTWCIQRSERFPGDLTASEYQTFYGKTGPGVLTIRLYTELRFLFNLTQTLL